MDSALSSWWPIATAAHAPILLAWAALLRLGSHGGGNGSGGEEQIAASVQGHAAAAEAAGALGTLRLLSVHTGASPAGPEVLEMFNVFVLR